MRWLFLCFFGANGSGFLAVHFPVFAFSPDKSRATGSTGAKKVLSCVFVDN